MAQNRELLTQLFDAAENQRLYVVKKVLEQGVDINVVNIINETLLHVALRRGNRDLFKFLLKKEADFNKQDFHGNSPLISSLWYRRKFMTKKLLLGGADVNLQNDEGVSPLHIACWRGDHKMVHVLLERKAELETIHQVRTPLLVACALNRRKVATELLRRGANVNVSDGEGMTPLHYACVYNLCELVYLLLVRNAEVDARTHQGNTPLHIAATGHSRIMILLLARGATIDVKNCFDETPYDICLKFIHAGLETRTILLSYIVRLNTAGIPVDIAISEEFDKQLSKQQAAICVQELDVIKTVKISNIPLVLMFPEINRQTCCLLSIKDLQNFHRAIHTTSFGIAFPIYHYILKNCFDKYYLATLADEVLSRKFSYKLPHLARQHIIFYLSVDDLQNLVKSGKRDDRFSISRNTSTMFNNVVRTVGDFVTLLIEVSKKKS